MIDSRIPPERRAAWRRRLDLLAVRRAARHSTQTEMGLTLGPRLEARPVERKVTDGIDFLRPPELGGVDSGRSGAFRAYLDAQAEKRRAATSVAEEAATVPWYHTIELPGFTTPGFYDHRPLVPHYGLPADLTGQRALDVATFNGFWAFELERRGAEVTALDLPSSRAYDLPPPLRAMVDREGIDIEPGASFKVAAKALGSRVDHRLSNVYDLEPEAWGKFDFVHVGDLLVHLERPLEALRAIRSVTSGRLHVSDTFDPRLVGPTMRYMGGWTDMEWWAPSFDALVQMISDAGFTDIRTVGTYQLNTREGVNAHWRAILTASA